MKNLINSVRLIGYLGMDPEVKKLESGKIMARFSMATNDSYTNAEGKKIEDTQWHKIVAWGKTAEIAEKYLHKGSEVAIEGKLNTRSYESEDGQTKYMTEVVVKEIMMLGSKAN